ncbi:MAG: toxic anion resistance protein [Geminicoccaceae bacterium]
MSNEAVSTPSASMPTTATAAPMTNVEATLDKVLPEVSSELVPYEQATPEQRQKIDDLVAEIDITDTNSIIFFGTKAQEELTQISEQMLEGVRNKDIGPAGDALGKMVNSIQGFDVEELAKKPGFFGRLFGAMNPVQKIFDRYEEVRTEIDKISNELDRHKGVLLRDIEQLDRLYDGNLDYFHRLEEYIIAGDEKLRQLDSEIIPAKEKTVGDDTLQAQELRDLRQARDDLERRVHDLKLTRQVTMQSLPSIRLVQENDKSLVTMIYSTMANTIPLWKNQLAQAVTIVRSGEAAETLKEATDLTNELLQKNAENLQQANRTVREQVERGVFDIETVKKANETLIATINESLQIADEGKKKRAAAEVELQKLETELRTSLTSAKSRATAPAETSASGGV